MRPSLPRTILATLLMASLPASALPASELTAEDLIAKHIEARGGLAALKAIHTIRFEGIRSQAGGGSQMVYTRIIERPGSIRTTLTQQGLTMIEACAGREGWSVRPFGGRKEPERLSEEAMRPLVYAADIDGPLVEAKAKGHTVTYLGTEDVDGTMAHLLKVTRATGDVERIYLDPDYFLEIRRVSQRTVRGALIESETDYGNYEKVNGVYFPFSIETGERGSTDKETKLAIDKAEANMKVDDAIFRFPAPSTPTGAAGAAKPTQSRRNAE